MIPTICPTCHSETIERILSDVLLSAHIRGLRCSSSGVVAYHCGVGHVFLVVDEDFRWSEVVPQVRGSAVPS